MIKRLPEKKIPYINDDPVLGIDYDWEYIFKEFKKLGVPDNVYKPVHVPVTLVKYILLLSERATGKTTNWLLVGLIMWQRYGTITQYIRQSEDMIRPKVISKLFDVIIGFGYITSITGGEYDEAIYKARNWYLVKRNEAGEIEKQSTPIMYCLDLDEAAVYKSSYNAPLGDLIIFDEFVSKSYYPNEFVTFCDVVKTIIRKRHSPIVVMLANTIERYNTYFSELNIQEDILQIKTGDSMIKYTDKGTGIYAEIIGTKDLSRAYQNELFFGFKNPRLAAITGGDWAIDNYPHIEPDKERKSYERMHYIKYNGYLVNMEFCRSKKLGAHVIVHKATKTYDDSIIYTIDDIGSVNERYRFGRTSYDKMIWSLYNNNKWYYSNNEVGNVVRSYVNQAKAIIR